LNNYNDSPFLVLTFSVSKSHEMENLQVESSDDQLASYVKKALAKEKIKVNPVFDGKKGQVPIQLPSKG
jgi:ribosome recycling factor